MRLTSHPKVIQVVTDLLGGNSDIKIFATRLLCKLPKIGVTIPWHQDSRYYTLNDPKMVNFWIAVDDVSPENGAMNMINYTALPESRQNLPLVRDNRGGFPNSIDPKYIKDEDVMVMDLMSGEAEFHDGFIAHGSPPNLSDKRRCAWIARYVPGHVKLVGKQMLPHIYNEDYKIVPILKL